MLRPALAALLLLPAPVLAQEGPRLAFTLGLGAESVPSYFGSDDADIGPGFDFDLGYLGFGPLRFGDADDVAAPELGWGFRGSFRYVPGRDSGDDEDLAGLDDIDASYELGGGLRYAGPNWEAFAVARYGIGGSEAIVGDLGVDFVATPTDRLSLRAGPRLTIGSDDYAQTYFGVTQAEADASAAGPATAFDASGGILSGGLEVQADYALTDAWGLRASVTWERLLNDAAASPITTDDDQLTAFVGVTRRFDIRF